MNVGINDLSYDLLKYILNFLEDTTICGGKSQSQMAKMRIEVVGSEEHFEKIDLLF